MIAPNDPLGGAIPKRQKVSAIPENPDVTDSSNAFCVCARGDGAIGVYALPLKHLSKAQALNLAAWLAVIADPEGKEFERVVKEIRSK